MRTSNLFNKKKNYAYKSLNKIFSNSLSNYLDYVIMERSRQAQPCPILELELDLQAPEEILIQDAPTSSFRGKPGQNVISIRRFGYIKVPNIALAY